MSPIKLHSSPQKFLRNLLLVVLLIGGALYVSWQARFLIAGPKVAIEGEMSTAQNERVIMLKGAASNVTKLYLNGRPIAINQQGGFVEGVVLENGHTIVSIDAEDRYGRRVHWEKPFVYVKEEGAVVQR